MTEDLEALVEARTVSRYELTGRQILLYLTDLASGQVRRFEYRLRARFPLKAQAPSSRAYDYYTPERGHTAAAAHYRDAGGAEAVTRDRRPVSRGT